MIEQIFDHYNNYKNHNLDSLRITHSLLKQEIKKLASGGVLSIKTIGQSINGLDIFSITIGNGKTKILAWSQMHGDEPTATGALFDLINFFIAKDEYEKFKNDILNKIEITILPMLNPDGAQQHNRVNFINIDINRDALKKVSNESKILWKLAEEIIPEFGFNLHDQNSYYTAGRNNNTAAISLLAPPIDYDKTIDDTRKKSMQLISIINKKLNKYIPGRIARYNDDYEPRAFGDNFTKSGISSILIESGFLLNDENKSFIRKLNFISILTALSSIVDKTYFSENVEDYFSIPENETLLFDLLLRNLTLQKNGSTFLIDIGVNRNKKYDVDTNTFYFTGMIKEVGDLSTYYGIEEYDFNGYNVEITKTFENIFNSPNELEQIDYTDLHKNGYGVVRFDKELLNKKFISYPISAIPFYKIYNPTISEDEYANLLIKKNDKVEYVIINGFLNNVNEKKNRILNGLVIS